MVMDGKFIVKSMVTMTIGRRIGALSLALLLGADDHLPGVVALPDPHGLGGLGAAGKTGPLALEQAVRRRGEGAQRRHRQRELRPSAAVAMTGRTFPCSWTRRARPW